MNTSSASPEPSLPSVVLTYSAYFIGALALASVFGRVAGVQLAWRGFVLPTDWMFPSLMAVGGVAVWGMAWLGDRPVVRRKPWLWLPLSLVGIVVFFMLGMMLSQ